MGRSSDISLPNSTPFLNDPGARTVVLLIETAGYEIYFVGGCVRNALIGAQQSDIDLSTNARPETVMELGQAAGLRVIPTGIEHGTVTLVSHNQPFEITTFRRDVQTDGRRAVVAFSNTLEDDARRRDFTMNALYAKLDGSILDPVGGAKDALAGNVVFIDDAKARIKEDYLRVLRFFRFWTWYADHENGFDPETLAAIAENLDGLTALSAERIGSEMKKLLSAPDPAMAISTMQTIGVLQAILPIGDSNALNRLIYLEEKSQTEPDAIRRLASLGPEDAKTRLRLSRQETRDLTELTEAASKPLGPKAIGAELGAQRGWDAILLRAASLGTPLECTKADVAIGAETEFPVEAKDLMPMFIGAELGAELKRLREIWLKSELSLDKAALLG